MKTHHTRTRSEQRNSRTTINKEIITELRKCWKSYKKSSDTEAVGACLQLILFKRCAVPESSSSNISVHMENI